MFYLRKTFIFIVSAFYLSLFQNQLQATTLKTAEGTTALARLPLAYAALYNTDSKSKNATIIRLLRDLNRFINQTLMIYDNCTNNESISYSAFVPLIFCDIINLKTDLNELLAKVTPQEEKSVSLHDEQEVTNIRFIDRLKSISKWVLPLLETAFAYIHSTTQDTAFRLEIHSCLSIVRTCSQWLESGSDTTQAKIVALTFMVTIIAFVLDKKTANDIREKHAREWREQLRHQEETRQRVETERRRQEENRRQQEHAEWLRGVQERQRQREEEQRRREQHRQEEEQRQREHAAWLRGFQEREQQRQREEEQRQQEQQRRQEEQRQQEIERRRREFEELQEWLRRQQQREREEARQAAERERMNNIDNPYARLGIGRNATAADVTRAFRDLSRTQHPDHGGNTENYQRIVAARNLLLDPDQRAHYDNHQR